MPTWSRPASRQIPLFLRQVAHQRRMSALQPQLAEIRRRYRADRPAMQRELVEVQQEADVRPLAVTRAASDPRNALYGCTARQTLSAANARLLGAPRAASLLDGPGRIQALFGAVTATNPSGAAGSIGRLMRYAIPLSVLASGLYFPLGMLLYWLTSNLWTLGQQCYVIRRGKR